MMEPFVEDVVAAAYDDTLTPDDRAVLIIALKAVPHEKYENALSIANLHGMGREKAEAEADRLRGLIMEHRAAVFIATPIATANHQLWREALDRATENGDE